MELDLSTADPAAVLLPELLPALHSSRLLPPSLALRGDGQLGDDGLVALVGVLVGVDAEASFSEPSRSLLGASV